MASSSSQKRKKRTPSPFKGEGSSGSTQSESHEVTERPAFPLWDPWYSPSLSFPQVSYAWVFFGQVGFASSA